jgi:hypothetical protein
VSSCCFFLIPAVGYDWKLEVVHQLVSCSQGWLTLCPSTYHITQWRLVGEGVTHFALCPPKVQALGFDLYVLYQTQKNTLLCGHWQEDSIHRRNCSKLRAAPTFQDLFVVYKINSSHFSTCTEVTCRSYLKNLKILYLDLNLGHIIHH